MTWFLAYGTMGLLMLVGILLMIIILLQRGRGGGLAGAFGGAGGQSAFGTRAGDVFTKITAVMAIIWVFLAGVSRFALEPAATQFSEGFKSEAQLRDEQNPEGTVTTDPDRTAEEEEETDDTPTPPGGDNPPDLDLSPLDPGDGPTNEGDANGNDDADENESPATPPDEEPTEDENE